MCEQLRIIVFSWTMRETRIKSINKVSIRKIVPPGHWTKPALIYFKAPLPQPLSDLIRTITNGAARCRFPHNSNISFCADLNLKLTLDYKYTVQQIRCWFRFDFRTKLMFINNPQNTCAYTCHKDILLMSLDYWQLPAVFNHQDEEIFVRDSIHTWTQPSTTQTIKLSVRKI